MSRYVKKTPGQWAEERRRREEIRAGEARALKVTKAAAKAAAKEAAEEAAEEAAKAAKAAKAAAKAAKAAANEKATREAERDALERPRKLSKNGGYFPEEYNKDVEEMYAEQVKEYESKPDEWRFNGTYWTPIGKNPLAKKG